MTKKEDAILEIHKEKYTFLKENIHLGKNIILLGLGGSRAYGTELINGTSDWDVRGISLNTKAEILTNERFEQFENKQTDTTIYC